MAELGIPKKLRKKASVFFAVNTGLNLGDALCPSLFNAALENILWKANTETLLLFRNQGSRIILAFADDKYWGTQLSM